jgi:transglutaminase-like putative cysteine protease
VRTVFAKGGTEVPAATYVVVHTTRYAYTEPVSVSHHIARLSPRPLPYQQCLQHDLQIDPAPAMTATHADYFGNPTTFFVMDGEHRTLTVRAESRIAVGPRDPPEPAGGPRWEDGRDHDLLPLDAIDCVFETVAAPLPADFAAYARPSFSPGRPLLDAVLDLTRRIHGEFAFDPQATTVATPLTDVLRLRRGVCQDFARFEIACLRSLGLAARYVSGYLETDPPPGTERLAGADASHAWLAFFCPGTGWIDVDPTNNLLPSTRHITLGWGRDYTDVSPVRGVILGGGDHSLEVSVDVVRV